MDRIAVGGRLVFALNAMAHHPQLALHLHQGEAMFLRRFIAIELRTAQKMYSKFVLASWDDIAETYRRGLKSYPNSYLYGFCRRLKPKVIVETGVHYGASSAFILQALHDNNQGKLYSIDLPDREYLRDDGTLHRDALHSDRVGWVVPEFLRDRWQLVLGDAKQKLPETLSALGSIDIFHHDSMHTYEHMQFEYKTAWPRLRVGGILMSDDVSWNTAFSDFCHDKDVESHISYGAGWALKVHGDSLAGPSPSNGASNPS